MATSARWTKFGKQSGEWEPALPPSRYVQVLTARGRWPFPVIEMVTETPLLRPDGTVLDSSGYDEATGILYLPNCSYLDVCDEPTAADARFAVSELTEPFVEFPFRSLDDASVLLAGILTVLARPAISGPTPFFVIRKNAPGVGGSLAADAISVITTGRRAPRLTLTADNAELRKLILSIAIEGTPLILFDNLEGVIGTPVLAAALTAETWADRLLGFNKTVKAPLRPTWFATGNGLGFKRDIGRRVALCDMVTDLEYPEDRDSFRHDDLLGYVADQRPKLIRAALTILRAYAVAGRPEHGKPRKGGFVPWDRWVRGALIWAKAHDPAATAQRVRKDVDTDLESLRGALEAWRKAFPEPVTAAAAMTRANATPELRDALAALSGCPTDKLDGRRIATHSASTRSESQVASAS